MYPYHAIHYQTPRPEATTERLETERDQFQDSRTLSNEVTRVSQKKEEVARLKAEHEAHQDANQQKAEAGAKQFDQKCEAPREERGTNIRQRLQDKVGSTA